MHHPSSCRRPAVIEFAVAFILSAVAVGGTAWAEKGDREKPVHIEADRMMLDDAKKESVFEGNVVVTQGTLQIRGDRVIVRQDADGFQYGIAYGRPATFRQKRDGVDEYIDGYAERLEYDGKKDLLQMFNAARLKKDQDEVAGDYIYYNAKTEFFQVNGGPRPAAAPGAPEGRVKAVIQPKPKSPPASTAKPQAENAQLKPSATLERGR